MSETPVDVALVGIGRRGWCHLEILCATPGLRLAAVCDANTARLDEARQFAGGDVLAVTRPADLAKAKPAFAVVCTMQDTQPGIVETLLDAGIPSLVEVPPAYDGPTIRRLLERAAAAGLPLGSVENYPCTPLERLKQQLIAAGTFGRVARAELAGSVGHKGHEIAVARHYLGTDAHPVRARAERTGEVSRFSGEAVDVPTGLAGLVEFSDGSEAAFSLRAIRADQEDDLAAADLRCEFRGERGGFWGGAFHLPEGEATLERDCHEVDGVEVPRSLRLAEVPDVAWRNPFADTAFPPASRRPYLCALDAESQSWEIALADAYVDMAEAVRTGRRPEYDVAHSLVDVRIRLAMIQSTRRGGDWVDWQEEPYPVEREIAGKAWLRDLLGRRWVRKALTARARLLGRTS